LARSAELTGSFGPYEIVEPLGAGGMATVYRALDPGGNTVALKVLSDELARDNEFVNRFRRESRVLLSLKHPNVIRGYDAGEYDGKLYIATEYVEGRSIGDILELGGRFPQEVVLHVAGDIAQALEYSWSLEIVHRDIKPDNIMIGSDGRVRLADFGLARSVAPEATQLSRSGSIVGTADYISPEQVTGEGTVDVRSDIYSLGGSLYHMLCGEKPCPGQTPGDVIRNLVRGIIVPLAKRAPSVSKPVRDFVEKMMSRDPAQRFQTPAELLAEVTRIPCDPASILTLSFFGTAQLEELRALLEKSQFETTNVIRQSDATTLMTRPEPTSPPSSDAVLDDPLLAKIPSPDSRKRLGGVTILSKIGQGGMGAVYRGRHELLGIDVAVKVMLFHLAHDGEHLEQMRRRFRREARLAVRMDHPGIVRTLEIAADEKSGLSYLVMEMVEGHTAGELIDQANAEGSALPERQVLEIAKQAAEALSSAHRQGVVHRDIKPGNLLVRKSDGRVKIADLGLAKSLVADDSQGLTRTDAAVGSPAYMAPEQALDAKTVGHAADIYALGASLYHMAMGMRPFEAENLYTLIHMIVSLPPRSPRELRPGLSVNTQRIIERAMQKDPIDRYQTADEMAADIGRALESLDTGDVVVRDSARLAQGRKIKVGIIVGTAAAVGLIGGILFALFAL
jgi:serine/threonine protein kinase